MNDTLHIEPTEEQIQKEAYYLWHADGCPSGRDLDYWLAAKELLRHRHARPTGAKRRRARADAVAVPIEPRVS